MAAEIIRKMQLDAAALSRVDITEFVTIKGSRLMR
jgi:hypothetical protein